MVLLTVYTENVKYIVKNVVEMVYVNMGYINEIVKNAVERHIVNMVSLKHNVKNVVVLCVVNQNGVKQLLLLKNTKDIVCSALCIYSLIRK